MIFNRLSKIIQIAKDENRNRASFKVLCLLGWPAPIARGMLIKGNRIRVNKLAEDAPVSAPTIYAAAYEQRPSPDGRAALARAFDMKVDELFPDAN